MNKFSAVFIEVMEGKHEQNTFWGDELFFEGDEFVYVDIAACVSNSSFTNTHICSDPIDSINVTVLHELTHWAGEDHMDQTITGWPWNYFLNSLQNKRNVK